MRPEVEDLIRRCGDRLRGMDHAEYSALAIQACGPSPAVESAIAKAKRDPESRFTNVARDRVLKHLAGVGPQVAVKMAPPRGREPGDEIDVHGLDLG